MDRGFFADHTTVRSPGCACPWRSRSFRSKRSKPGDRLWFANDPSGAKGPPLSAIVGGW
jgi:hypothetical protein